MENIFQNDENGYKQGILICACVFLGEFMMSMIITLFVMGYIPPDVHPLLSGVIMWGTLILSYLAMLIFSWGILQEFWTDIEDKAEAIYSGDTVWEKAANHPTLYMKAFHKDEFWECNVHQNNIEGYIPEFEYRMGLPNGWGVTSNDVEGMIADGFVGIYRPYEDMCEEYE